jgi:hypothetical protein
MNGTEDLNLVLSNYKNPGYFNITIVVNSCQGISYLKSVGYGFTRVDYVMKLNRKLNILSRLLEYYLDR